LAIASRFYWPMLVPCGPCRPPAPVNSGVRLFANTRHCLSFGLMFPRSLIGRFLAIAWLLLCVGILAFGYIQRSVHDMPIAFFWLTLFITLPVGVVSAWAWPFILSSTSNPEQTFLPYAIAWFVSVALGYQQWFVLLPWAWRKIPSDRLKLQSTVLLMTGVAAAAWGLNELRQGQYIWFVGRIAICCIIALALLKWAARNPTEGQA
jgi:hypothetical protein